MWLDFFCPNLSFFWSLLISNSSPPRKGKKYKSLHDVYLVVIKSNGVPLQGGGSPTQKEARERIVSTYSHVFASILENYSIPFKTKNCVTAHTTRLLKSPTLSSEPKPLNWMHNKHQLWWVTQSTTAKCCTYYHEVSPNAVLSLI